MSKKKSKTSDQAEVTKKTKSKAKAATAAEAAPAEAAAVEPVPVETAAEAKPAEAAAVEPVPAETTAETAAAPSTSGDGIPAALNTPEFAAAWTEWLKFTEDRGIDLEANDQIRQLDLLAKLGPDAAIADIRKTMAEHPLKDRVATPGAEAGKARKAKAKKEPKAKKMSALDAAAKVLEEAGGSMTTQEMIDAMAKKGLWSSPGGLTPAATLYSAILRETNTKGADARFKKTERGKFARA